MATIGILLFSTWLIGSGFSSRKFKLRSTESIKFFVITIITFGSIAFYSLLSYAQPANYKLVNNIRIPLSRCINGSERIIPDVESREKYCFCLAEKITADSSLKNKYKNELQKGQLDKILNELQEEGTFDKIGLENCFSKVEMTWTDNLANSMKANLKSELEGTDFEQTNDIDIYCSCLIKEYRKNPLSKIMEDDFYESELACLLYTSDAADE